MAGTNATVLTGSQRREPVVVIDGQAVLELATNDQGFLDVYASIRDSQGRTVATFSGNNAFEIDQRFADVSKTHSTIELKEGGKVLFRIEYLNASAVKVAGTFTSSDGKRRVAVEPGYITLGPIRIRNVCFERAPVRLN